MKTEDLIFIETSIKHKYNNFILPEIVDIIKNYIFQNNDLHQLYLNKNINVEKLIKYIVFSKTESITEKFIFESIRSYIEGKLWII